MSSTSPTCKPRPDRLEGDQFICLVGGIDAKDEQTIISVMVR